MCTLHCSESHARCKDWFDSHSLGFHSVVCLWKHRSNRGLSMIGSLWRFGLGFWTLWGCKSALRSVETILQILNFGLFLGEDTVSCCWTAAAPGQARDHEDKWADHVFSTSGCCFVFHIPSCLRNACSGEKKKATTLEMKLTIIAQL